MKKMAKRALVIPGFAAALILGTMSVAMAAGSSGSGTMPDALPAQLDDHSAAIAMQLPQGTQLEQADTVAAVVTPPTTPTTPTTTTPTTPTAVAGQQTAPTVVAGQQTTPATGQVSTITQLPSTATGATNFAMIAAGFAAMLAGILLWSRRLAR